MNFFQGLLLLIEMTKGNSNIQKIVAFENAFERLLDIVAEEGSSDGGRYLRVSIEHVIGSICYCNPLSPELLELIWYISRHIVITEYL